MMNGKRKYKPTKPKPQEDQIILIGDEAWQAWDNGNGTLWQMLNENLLKLGCDFKPYIFGENPLKNIPAQTLAPKTQEYIKLFECGQLSEPQRTAICHNLATKTAAKVVSLHNVATGELIENFSPYIERIRKGEAETAKIIAQASIDQNALKTSPYIDYRENGLLEGLFYVVPKLDKDTGEVLREDLKWICDKLELIGKGKNENGDYFYIFQWHNPDEKEPRIEAINCGDFGTDTAWRLLKNQGFKMTPKTGIAQNLVEHFHALGLNVQSWAVTHSTGWHNGAYLLPSGEILGEPSQPIIFKNKSANANGYDTKGTLESWQQEIARYANKNTSMMLGIATALASPLLRLINAKSFGVHLFNSSSKGKTTTLNIANSLYGNPDLIDLSWNTTATALNNEAAARNDGFITLDELGQAKKIYDVENIAYSLFNEKGRAKGMKEGGNDELSRWKITALSTGEKDVEGFLQSKGVNINAGQLVRLLNIPLIEANHLHGFANNKAHADHLNEASLNHYGVVGREWIKYIAENKAFIKAEYQRYKTEWAERLANNTAAQVQRVASNFAILETALQTARHLTLWAEADNRECLIQSFNDWHIDYGTGEREEEKIIEFFNGWLDENAESGFIQVPEPTTQRIIQKILGYRVLEVFNGEPEHFYIHPKAFKDVIKESEFPRKLVFEAMEKHKMLKTGTEQNQRPYQHKVPTKLERYINSKGKRFFIVYPALIEETEKPEE